jgi:hypothetical protein
MSKAKSVKAPAVAAPAAVPETDANTEDSEVKKVRRAMGYQSSVLTGSLTPKSTGLKTTLGK